ncbi:MAG: S16 family serine protease [Nitrospiraceae bacterium]
MAKLTVPLRVVLMLVLAASVPPAPALAGGASRVISVPALGVQGEGLPGVVNYILIQFDRTTAEDGPTVQFNEVNLGGGSLVGEEWKEGVRRAVRAVTQAVGDDGRDWLVTIKNRSLTALTDGMSASAAVAVGIMAAYRGDVIESDIVLSGEIMPDGRLDVVGGLHAKIEAAAGAHYRAIVVPRDQVLTPDWMLTTEVASRNRVQLIQAGTLEEAYQAMTAKSR